MAVSILAGMVMQYFADSPMRALFWSAVINGIVAVPLIVIVILLSSSGTVTGGYTASLANRVLARLAAIVMGVAAVLTFVAA